MSRLLVIVGPTAIGKSQLALDLAEKFGGEIISADSRQVYRYMDIGTAKPTPEERARVPHHLIDLINPDEDFSLAQYQELAYQVIHDVQRRQKLPLLVGGTGLYVWAVVEGLKIPQVPPNPEFRRQMEERASREGALALYRQLEQIDPEAAKKIDPNNLRRIIRALEVHHETSVPFSQLQRREPPPFESAIIGLTTERSDLYRRIDQRVDHMIELGLVDEVKRLLEMGYGPELHSMSGIGYKQVCLYLQGKMDLPTAIQQIKNDTHRFARHQYAWFRLSDPRIRWFDVREEYLVEINRLPEQLANKNDRG